MTSLFSKLSIALVLLVGAMGSAFFLIDRVQTRMYYEELTQTLNAPIAMYVTGQRELIRDGSPDLDSLRELASHAMVINPTAEIYLLDQQGRVLGHGLPDGTVILDSIDLAPVRELVEGGTPMPILGDDPRSASQRKVFSAAEVRSGDRLEGYLYVVLGGERYEALADDISASYVSKVSIVAVAVIVVLAAAIGLLVFGLLTRRLKVLSREVQQATSSGFQEPTTFSLAAGTGDEIDQLARSFATMSEQIRAQIEQLRENDLLRRELVSNISHDLRTPLAAMQGYIETLILKGEELTASERDEYLRIARRNAVRLGTLIEDLFELSKLDSASVTPHVEAFSMAELVQDLAMEFQLDAERKAIALRLDVASEAKMTLGDIGLIQRVLENLVRNAIKFTPEGGEITISIDERPAALAVAVTDNGPGIPQQDLPRIFDRFYRSVQGEEARSDSAGLGLAIVKRILDLHDSRITVSSKLDAGTKFEFELPIFEQAA